MPATLQKQQYERHKERTRARQADLSSAGRELYPLPPVANPQRKLDALRSLRVFCEIYFAETFNLAWSNDHLEFIAQLERAVIAGCQKVQAMPRGNGKTSLCQAAALWAVLRGSRRFVVIVGSTSTKGSEILEDIREQLETNEMLGEDFPDSIGVIQSLGQTYQKLPLYRGEPVKVRMKAKLIRLPQIPGAVGGGAVFYADGILGKGLRGLKKRRKGESLRPDLVLIDDPQDDDSAISPLQNAKRLKIIKGTILGLAGPRTKLAVLAAVTVIAKNDLADQLLDRQLYPAWHGSRTKFISKVPESPLWDEYWGLRANAQRAGDHLFRTATEFYQAHQAEMDGDTVASWPDRFEEGEISGIQRAMNIIQDRGRDAFYAEFQNDPLAIGGDIVRLEARDVREKLNHLRMGVVPDWATHLVFDIDVQDSILFYQVKAGRDGFETSVVEYGCYPKQSRRYFAVREVKNTLMRKLLADQPGGEGAAMPTRSDQDMRSGSTLPVKKEQAIYAGLMHLANELCGRGWKRENGTDALINLGTIDAQDGDHRSIVYQVCRESRFKHLLLPRHGKGIGAKDTPMTEWTKRPAMLDQVGDEWRKGLSQNERQFRLLFDSNHWKSFSQRRWMTVPGAAGCCTMFESSPAGRGPDLHLMFADHKTAEYPTRVTAKTKNGDRTVDEWRMLPGKSENHWGDTDVACDVALSVCGVKILDLRVPIGPQPRVFKKTDLPRRIR